MEKVGRFPVNRVSNFLAKLMPVAIPLRRLIPTFGTLVVGTALSFGMFAEIWEEESEIRRVGFERLADERIAALGKSVGSALDVLHALEGLFVASEFVTRREFEQFVGHLPKSKGVVQAFEWIPRVPQAEREKYERVARA
ncbi:MAG: CHASE domain-containing protein, partial [SAR324 cluster bacterium]|nr:CHASE domain-containing protein [SAR324 cluster bacterium]